MQKIEEPSSQPPSRQPTSPSLWPTKTTLSSMRAAIYAAALSSIMLCLTCPLKAETINTGETGSMHPFCLSSSKNQVAGVSTVSLVASAPSGSSFNISTIYFGGESCGKPLGDFCRVDNEFKVNRAHRYNPRFAPPATAHHCCAIDQTSTIMACFGGTSNSHLVYRYSLNKSAWLRPLGLNISNTEQLELGLIRRGHACSVVDDTFYVWGGVDPSGRHVKEVMIATSIRKSFAWTAVEEARQFGRSGHAVVQSGHEIIALFGQPSSAARNEPIISFDVDTRIFKPVITSSSFPSIRDGVACTTFDERIPASFAPQGIYCAGGRLQHVQSMNAESVNALQTFDRLLHIDIATGDWRDLGALPSSANEWGMTLSPHVTERFAFFTLQGGKSIPQGLPESTDMTTGSSELSTCAFSKDSTSLFYLLSREGDHKSGSWMTADSMSKIIDIDLIETTQNPDPAFYTKAVEIDPVLFASLGAFSCVFSLVSVWLLIYCWQRTDGGERRVGDERLPLMSSSCIADDLETLVEGRGGESERYVSPTVDEHPRSDGPKTTTFKTVVEGLHLPGRGETSSTNVQQLYKSEMLSTSRIQTTVNTSTSSMVFSSNRTDISEAISVVEKMSLNGQVPACVLHGWWDRFRTYIATRCTSFSESSFLKILSETTKITEESVLLVIQTAGGTSTSMDDFAKMNGESLTHNGCTLLHQLKWLHETLLVIGLSRVQQQVIPLLTQNVKMSNEIQTTAAPTTFESERAAEEQLISSADVLTSTAHGVPADKVALGTVEASLTSRRHSKIVITLTKSTINSKTKEIISTEEFVIEIPSFAMYGWWSRLITFFHSRGKSLHTIVFLTALAEVESLTDASVMASFKLSGCELTAEELALLKKSTAPSDTCLMELLEFVRKTVGLAGAEVVAEQVLPLFDHFVKSSAATAETTMESNSATKEETVSLKPGNDIITTRPTKNSQGATSSTIMVANELSNQQSAIDVMTEVSLPTEVLGSNSEDAAKAPLLENADNVHVAKPAAQEFDIGQMSDSFSCAAGGAVIANEDDRKAKVEVAEVSGSIVQEEKALKPVKGHSKKKSHIEITLTKQTANPKTGEMMDSVDFCLSIPGAALHGWWRRVTATVVSRYSSFNAITFLTCLAEIETFDSDTRIVQALSMAGAPMSWTELDALNQETLNDGASLFELLCFLRNAVRLVGPEIVMEKVVPLFDCQLAGQAETPKPTTKVSDHGPLEPINGASTPEVVTGAPISVVHTSNILKKAKKESSSGLAASVTVTISISTWNLEHKKMDIVEHDLTLPGYALSGWWRRVLNAITIRYTKFNVKAFLKCLGSCTTEDLPEFNLMEAFEEAGAPLTKGEFKRCQQAAAVGAEANSLLHLMLLVRKVVHLVGVEATMEQVIPLFDYNTEDHSAMLDQSSYPSQAKNTAEDRLGSSGGRPLETHQVTVGLEPGDGRISGSKITRIWTSCSKTTATTTTTSSTTQSQTASVSPPPQSSTLPSNKKRKSRVRPNQAHGNASMEAIVENSVGGSVEASPSNIETEGQVQHSTMCTQPPSSSGVAVSGNAIPLECSPPQTTEPEPTDVGLNFVANHTENLSASAPAAKTSAIEVVLETNVHNHSNIGRPEVQLDHIDMTTKTMLANGERFLDTATVQLSENDDAPPCVDNSSKAECQSLENLSSSSQDLSVVDSNCSVIPPEMATTPPDSQVASVIINGDQHKFGTNSVITISNEQINRIDSAVHVKSDTNVAINAASTSTSFIKTPGGSVTNEMNVFVFPSLVIEDTAAASTVVHVCSGLTAEKDEDISASANLAGRMDENMHVSSSDNWIATEPTSSDCEVENDGFETLAAFATSEVKQLNDTTVGVYLTLWDCFVGSLCSRFPSFEAANFLPTLANHGEITQAAIIQSLHECGSPATVGELTEMEEESGFKGESSLTRVLTFLLTTVTGIEVTDFPTSDISAVDTVQANATISTAIEAVEESTSGTVITETNTADPIVSTTCAIDSEQFCPETNSTSDLGGGCLSSVGGTSLASAMAVATLCEDLSSTSSELIVKEEVVQAALSGTMDMEIEVVAAAGLGTSNSVEVKTSTLIQTAASASTVFAKASDDEYCSRCPDGAIIPQSSSSSPSKLAVEYSTHDVSAPHVDLTHTGIPCQSQTPNATIMSTSAASIGSVPSTECNLVRYELETVKQNQEKIRLTADSGDEVVVVIPEYARGNWWTLLLDIVSRRFPEFDSASFLSAVGERTEITITIIVEILNHCGANITDVEIGRIEEECGFKEEVNLVKLLTFVKTIVQLVGVSAFQTSVLSKLATMHAATTVASDQFDELEVLVRNEIKSTVRGEKVDGKTCASELQFISNPSLCDKLNSNDALSSSVVNPGTMDAFGQEIQTIAELESPECLPSPVLASNLQPSESVTICQNCLTLDGESELVEALLDTKEDEETLLVGEIGPSDGAGTVECGNVSITAETPCGESELAVIPVVGTYTSHATPSSESSAAEEANTYGQLNFEHKLPLQIAESGEVNLEILKLQKRLTIVIETITCRFSTFDTIAFFRALSELESVNETTISHTLQCFGVSLTFEELEESSCQDKFDLVHLFSIVKEKVQTVGEKLFLETYLAVDNTPVATMTQEDDFKDFDLSNTVKTEDCSLASVTSTTNVSEIGSVASSEAPPPTLDCNVQKLAYSSSAVETETHILKLSGQNIPCSGPFSSAPILESTLTKTEMTIKEESDTLTAVVESSPQMTEADSKVVFNGEDEPIHEEFKATDEHSTGSSESLDSNPPSFSSIQGGVVDFGDHVNVCNGEVPHSMNTTASTVCDNSLKAELPPTALLQSAGVEEDILLSANGMQIENFHQEQGEWWALLKKSLMKRLPAFDETAFLNELVRRDEVSKLSITEILTESGMSITSDELDEIELECCNDGSKLSQRLTIVKTTVNVMGVKKFLCPITTAARRPTMTYLATPTSSLSTTQELFSNDEIAEIAIPCRASAESSENLSIPEMAETLQADNNNISTVSCSQLGASTALEVPHVGLCSMTGESVEETSCVSGTSSVGAMCPESAPSTAGQSHSTKKTRIDAAVETVDHGAAIVETCPFLWLTVQEMEQYTIMATSDEREWPFDMDYSLTPPIIMDDTCATEYVAINTASVEGSPFPWLSMHEMEYWTIVSMEDEHEWPFEMAYSFMPQTRKIGTERTKTEMAVMSTAIGCVDANALAFAWVSVHEMEYLTNRTSAEEREWPFELAYSITVPTRMDATEEIKSETACISTVITCSSPLLWLSVHEIDQLPTLALLLNEREWPFEMAYSLTSTTKQEMEVVAGAGIIEAPIQEETVTCSGTQSKITSLGTKVKVVGAFRQVAATTNRHDNNNFGSTQLLQHDLASVVQEHTSMPISSCQINEFEVLEISRIPGLSDGTVPVIDSDTPGSDGVVDLGATLAVKLTDGAETSGDLPMIDFVDNILGHALQCFANSELEYPSKIAAGECVEVGKITLPDKARTWWLRFVETITQKYSCQCSSEFLTAISQQEDITVSSIVEALNQSGATVTNADISTIQTESGCTDSSLVEHLTYVKTTVSIVGVAAFLTNIASSSETITTMTTTADTSSAAPTFTEVAAGDMNETTAVEEITTTTMEPCKPAVESEQIVETRVITEEAATIVVFSNVGTTGTETVVAGGAAPTLEELTPSATETDEAVAENGDLALCGVSAPATTEETESVAAITETAVTATVVGQAQIHESIIAPQTLTQEQMIFIELKETPITAASTEETDISGITGIFTTAAVNNSTSESSDGVAPKITADNPDLPGPLTLTPTNNTEEINIVVPEYAKGNWWTLLLQAITCRFSSFNSLAFLEAISKHEEITETTIVETLNQCGVVVTEEELVTIQDECGSKGKASLVQLLTFVVTTVKIVGVTTFLTTVISTLETSTTDSFVITTIDTSFNETDAAAVIAEPEGAPEPTYETKKPTTIITWTEETSAFPSAGEPVFVELKETTADVNATSARAEPCKPTAETLDQVEPCSSCAETAEQAVETDVIADSTEIASESSLYMPAQIVDVGTTLVSETTIGITVTESEPSVPSSDYSPAPYTTGVGKTVNSGGSAQQTLILENSTEVVVPEYAKGNWWTLLLQAITRRFSGFDSSMFLEAISKHEKITETTIVETLNQCCAAVSNEELVTIQDECGFKGEPNLVNLLTFVKTSVKIVGVETFLTSVVSILETSTVTTTTTITTVTSTDVATTHTSGEITPDWELEGVTVKIGESCETAAETVEQFAETMVVAEDAITTDGAKQPGESWFSKATHVIADGASAAGDAVLHAGKIASCSAVSGVTSAGSLISDGASVAGSALKYTAGAVATAAVVGAVAVGTAAVVGGELADSAAKTDGTAVVEGGEVALSSTVSAVKTTAGVAVDAAGAAGSAITYVADATGSAVVSGAAAVAGLVAGSSELAESVTKTVTTETITTTTTIVEQDQVQGPTVAVAAEEVAKDEIIAVELKETPAAPAGATDQVDTAVVSSTTTTTTTTTTVTDTSVTEPSVSVSALIPAPYVTEDGKTVNPDGPAQLTLTLKNSTEEVNVVVPEHAKGNWWTLLLQAITRRFSGFDSSAFLEAISKHEEITETTIVETLNQCSATVTKEELVTIQDECGCKGEASLVNLLTFVKRIIKIVGVTTFLTTVVSTLETSTSTVTTSTTTSTEETTGTAAPTSGEEVVFVDLKETAVVVEDVTATTTTGSAETCEPAAVVAETVEQVVETTVVTEETTVIDAAATATTAKKPAESWFSKATRIVKDGAVAAGGAVLHAGEVAGSAVAYGAQAAGSTVVEGITVVGSAVKSGAEAAGSAAVSGATSAGSLISDGASAAGSALKYTAGAVGTAAVVGAVAVGAAAVGAGELAGSAAKTVGTAVVEGGEVALSSTVSAAKSTVAVAVDAVSTAGSTVGSIAGAVCSAVVLDTIAAGLTAESVLASAVTIKSARSTIFSGPVDVTADTATTTMDTQGQMEELSNVTAVAVVVKEDVVAFELKDSSLAPSCAADITDTTATTSTTTSTFADSVAAPSVSVSSFIPAPCIPEDGKPVELDGPAQQTMILKNDAEEVTVLVPEYAKGNWWTLLVQTITRRCSNFEPERFLLAITKQEDITETTILESLGQCGVAVTKDELVSIQEECNCNGEARLVNLLTFVKMTVKVVGVTTFQTAVVSILETCTAAATSVDEAKSPLSTSDGIVFVDRKDVAAVETQTITTDSTDTCGIAVQPSQRENTTIDFMQSWALLKDSITRRFPEFDSEAFVIGVSEQEAVSESSIMASLSSCGAAVSAEELAIIAKECGCEIGPCFVSLMTFVKTTLKRETFVESEVSFGSLEETSIERFPALVSSSVAAMPPLVPSAAGIQQHGWLSRVAHIVKDGAVVAGAKLLHSGELASSIIVQGAQTAATSSVSALGFAVKSGVTAIAHVGDGASSAVVSSGKATSEVLIQRASTAGKRILTSASLAGSAVLESATKVGSAVACSSGAVIDVLRSVVTPTETCDSLSEEGSLKVNVTRKLTNEFYHSTMDAETVTIEVPSFLTGGWWTKFLEWFRSRQYTFDVTKFITSVGDAATISDNLLEDALKAAGVPITADSLEELKVHVWSGDTNVIIQTLRFIRKVVQLVGVATVEEDIIPAFNRKAAAKSDTTVTQITIRILKQLETDDGAVIVDSREETFDVPSIAFTGWWNKWSSDINGNYPSFGLTTFLSALGESDVVSDEIVLQALHAAGSPVSQDEVSLMKIDSESDSDSNSDSWSLFIFIRALIRVIGVEAVKQQVIPMFYESKCVRDGQSSVQSDDAEDGLSQIF